jgi:hypothetical protein
MSSLDKYKHSPTKTGSDTSDWNGEQGSSDMGRDKLRREPDKGYPKPRDISKLVDPSHKRTDGFSAKLDNPSDE